MGKYLDQCCDDAWEVIRGRKKIVGNKIVNIEDAKEIEKKGKEVYGWLAQARPKDNGDVGDLLTDMGWILIHNPHGYNFKITRNLSKRVTNKQKDYLCSIGKIDLLEKEFV